MLRKELDVHVLGKTIRGFIFDVDGTLLMSTSAHVASWAQAFEECGFFDVTPQLVDPIIGLAGKELVAALKPNLDKQTSKQILAAHRRIFNTVYLPYLHASRGARALLSYLLSCGLRLAAASSASKTDMVARLAAVGVDDLITLLISSDSVRQAKPAPDELYAATKEMNLQPNEVIFVGDQPTDIEAGHAAAVAVVALRCGGSSDNALAAADAIFDDPESLRLSLCGTSATRTGHF